MNRKQKICLWIGIIAFALVCLFSQMGNVYTKNTIEDTFVYILRLLVRWIIVGVITVGLIITFKETKTKNEVEKDNTEKRVWIREVVCILFGILLGTLSTLLVTYYFDWRKEVRTKKELTKMIYFDVLSTKRDLDNFLRDRPREKTMEMGKSIIANDYDTYVFEAYIHSIPLLPVETASRILAFYGDLKKANETKYILLNKDLSLKLEERRPWINNFYVVLERAIKNGEYILTNFKKQDEDNRLPDPNEPNAMSSQGTSTLQSPKRTNNYQND